MNPLKLKREAKAADVTKCEYLSTRCGFLPPAVFSRQPRRVSSCLCASGMFQEHLGD